MADSLPIEPFLRLISSRLISAAKDFVDFVFPQSCMLCDKDLVDGVSLVCETCWQHLPKPGSSVVVLPAGTACSKLIALWSYEGGVQEIIHEMKFRRKMVLAKRIGQDLASLLRQLPEIGKIDLIVPVPLHATRLRERGFNQSALIASAVSQQTGIAAEFQALKRTRYTRAQSKLTAHERKKNVQFAFSMSEDTNVRGKALLLVDDVTTTGATMEACAAALKGGGASQVLALAGARTELEERPVSPVSS